MLARYKGQYNTQHRLNVYIRDCTEAMTAISSYVCKYCVLGALCYVCVPNIDKLTIRTFQLELGEFAPGLEPLEFVSGECSSNIYIYIYMLYIHTAYETSSHKFS